MTRRFRHLARSRLTRILAFAVSFGAVCRPASAESLDLSGTDQRRAAQKMFEAADELYESGRFAEAAQAFRASHSTVASPNSRLMLARSLRELGKLGEAYDEFSGAVQDAEASAGRYPETHQAAKAERAALMPHLGFVTVEIGPGLAAAEDFEVAGRRLPATAVGSPVAVTPGRTTVRVRLADGSVFEQTLVVEQGRQATVQFPSEPAPPEVPPPKVTSAPPKPPMRSDPARAEPADTGTGLRTAAYVAGGVGVLGGVGFGVFGLLNRGTYQDLETSCPSGACPADRQSDIDAGERYQLLANVSLGVAIVGVAAGTTLFVLSTSSEPAPGTVAVRVLPGGMSVGGRF